MPATAFFSLSSNPHEKEHNSVAIEPKLRLHIQEAHPESEKFLRIRGAGANSDSGTLIDSLVAS
jgi:hypothetical protein